MPSLPIAAVVAWNLDTIPLLVRPGKPLALVEIKSAREVREEHAAGMRGFLDDFPGAEFFLLSQDPRPQRLGRIQALPWDQGILAI